MLRALPRDFSKFDSIFCCKAVPGVGGRVFAGVLRDNELKGRGCGRGGEVNKLSVSQITIGYGGHFVFQNEAKILHKHSLQI